MRTRNARLWKRFDAGEAVSCLDGQGSDFIPDITYRDKHDHILVVGQLLDWARERGRPDEPQAAILGAVDASLRRGEHRSALDILSAYGALRRSRKQLDKRDGDFLADTLERVLILLESEGVERESMVKVEALHDLARNALGELDDSDKE